MRNFANTAVHAAREANDTARNTLDKARARARAAFSDDLSAPDGALNAARDALTRPTAAAIDNATTDLKNARAALRVPDTNLNLTLDVLEFARLAALDTAIAGLDAVRKTLNGDESAS